ncbi:MAG: helix-turn-helix transcriptional regulator [Bacteroidota bacterium]
MPKFLPQDARLRAHIDYYWIVDESERFAHLCDPVHEFPSLAPELVLGIRGVLRYRYRGRMRATGESILFGYIEDGLTVYPAELEQMVVVKFKPRGLSSVVPFLPVCASELMREAVVPARDVFGDALGEIERHLATLRAPRIADELDGWLLGRLGEHRTGVVRDVFVAVTPTTSVRDLAALTQSSYSTLARHFKADTGLTPKQFLLRHRFKHVLADLFRTGSTDWFDYVARYGYHDQSHFIREIKRYTGYTPSRLLALPYLTHYRPEQSGDG